MSFVIGAIYKNTDVYLAADTKANSNSGIFKYPDIQKVFRLNSSSLIGIAGDYNFAKSVVDSIKPSWNSQQEMLLSLAVALRQQDTEWRQQYGKQFECTFILGGHLQGQPYMMLVLFHQGKLSMYDEPFVVGDYQYFLVMPTDTPYETCRDICEKILASKNIEDPEIRLTRTVQAIAARSHLVNEIVDVESVRR